MALAAHASVAAESRGRRHPEPAVRLRDDFQRDRDRIVHSTAFRRLVYKTQVFINHEGDLFRTRLTHSLEVAQLGRAIARGLQLNEDLVEGIALAHDLGHTPFGHAGQDALHDCMRAHGGFEHNLQSLRVVDCLEVRYPDFDGLNLCFETREGILKHCARRDAERIEAAEPGGVGRRFLDGTRPSLEAQLTNLADEIAYNAHDIDDGVRSGLLSLPQLEALPLVQRHLRGALRDHPALLGRRLLFEIIRRMLSEQIHDVIDTSHAAITAARPADAQVARLLPSLISFSPPMQAESTELKRLLMRHLYRHPQVMRTTGAARTVVRALFEAYAAAPGEMPSDFATRPDLPRAVADYVAGMTDRFATREHRRLTGRDEFAAAAGAAAEPQ
ncbi:deoxyguanosinetriphosphate triphosphohydrolase [Aquabacterium sp.]|uniref:deoxyguanosinetriphosphate triphosphohydrolase n=1 Tax=Aquabacterium sp. TaxID=1872578 RepID=UPI002D13F533|nr:deoxyguanosinetriphosphate triphosphohydrolase [Aquabacterium sp.]HSW08578.1 deoxyguanosinetriphosphate triphosphohydrolase [Aquabacterium sp.]